MKAIFEFLYINLNFCFRIGVLFCPLNVTWGISPLTNYSYIIISSTLTFCLSLYPYLLLCFKTQFFTQVTETSICFSKIALQLFKITLFLFWSNLASPVNHLLIASLKQETSSFEWSPEVICPSTENTIGNKRSDHKPPIPQKPFPYQKSYFQLCVREFKDVCLQFGGLFLTRGGFNSKSLL